MITEQLGQKLLLHATLSAVRLGICSPQPPVKPQDWDKSSCMQLRCFTFCVLFCFASEGNLQGQMNYRM